jgi:molybdopterin-guanine dinucleotide biosynthesis protein A
MTFCGEFGPRNQLRLSVPTALVCNQQLTTDNQQPTTDFTAALLAGGQSKRMGQDKAYLAVEWEGASVPLWERQWAVLQSIACGKLVISGPRKPEYPASVLVWPDDWPGAGPLGGIATCLSRMESAFVLVLAVDLPQIQPIFLKKLLARSEGSCGVVPRCDDHFEPLIALYPAAALPVAIDQLRKEDYVLQHFVAKLLQNRLIVGYEIEAGDQSQLENWNTPEDRGRARESREPLGW